MIKLLSIDLSNYCTKQCSFCYNHSNQKGNIMWLPEEVISFAKDCYENGVESISLGGGEPFEYEGVFKVIDAILPIVYLSVTTNGLPLLDERIWKQLMLHRPDKIHITIHQPDQKEEVDRVEMQLKRLSQTNIKPGLNLLVSNQKIEFCKQVYQRMIRFLQPNQIIMVPQRFSNTPTPKELASITDGKPFQSPSCLLGCQRPLEFCSVSWDKKVNSCSYAGGKQKLNSLDYKGLIDALNNVRFSSCIKCSS